MLNYVFHARCISPHTHKKTLEAALFIIITHSLALITEQALVFIELNWLRCQRRNSRQNWDIHHVGGRRQLGISAHADRMDSHSEERRLPRALRFGINDSWSGLLHSQGWSLDWWRVQREHNEVPSQAGKILLCVCVCSYCYYPLNISFLLNGETRHYTTWNIKEHCKPCFQKKASYISLDSFCYYFSFSTHGYIHTHIQGPKNVYTYFEWL